MAAPSVAAQGNTPEAVAQAYVTASSADRVLDASRWVHSDIRRTVGEAILVVMGANDEAGVPAVIPRESRSSYAGLSPEGAYERYYAGLNDMAETSRARRARTGGSSEIDLLGTVVEGDTTHVLFRVTDEAAGRLRVVSVREDREGWGVLPMEPNMASAMVEVAEALKNGTAGGAGRVPPPPSLSQPSPPRLDAPRPAGKDYRLTQ